MGFEPCQLGSEPKYDTAESVGRATSRAGHHFWPWCQCPVVTIDVVVPWRCFSGAECVYTAWCLLASSCLPSISAVFLVCGNKYKDSSCEI